ncbi:hypothetical protein FRC14_002871 [Serendipita sp. 396]|nr:hypothetical protein FRC14_002871 [Serendipita sp. 396]KAG8785993.1 hypothetical protein FRC15_000314 [Serendipita sp. 397]KAG8867596.1 hypothetical protein FRC20_005379 [Serendipita sp. 405]
MRSSTFILPLTLFLFGSFTIVDAAPVPGGDDDLKPTGTSQGGTPRAGGSRTPVVPPLPGSDFPEVSMEKLTDVCNKVDTKVLKMATSFEKNHGRMPDERTLTETIAYQFAKHEVGKITFHTQNQEGVSGTDFMFQMSLTNGFADELSSRLEVVGLTNEPQSIPPGTQTPTDSTGPGGKKQKGKSLVSTPQPAPGSPGLQNLEVPVAAGRQSRSRSRGGGHSPSEGTSTTAGKKVIIVAQAKSYHKKGDKNEEERPRAAGFTYKGKTAEKPQMHLLSDFAEKVRNEPKNKGVTVIAGYIVYGGEADHAGEYSKGIAWIPLSDVIESCKKHNGGQDCTAQSDDLDLKLSKEFMNLEVKKGQTCWLSDLLRPHFTSVH